MGFFREMRDALREGLAEGREELAKDAAAADQTKQAQAAQWVARVAATPLDEVFAVALGAVYRDVFLTELDAAARDKRIPAHLYVPDLPEDATDRVRKLLSSHFDVVDAAAAEVTLLQLEHDLSDPDHPDPDVDAVWITRASWVAIAAAGSGLIPRGRGLELVAPFVVRARARFGGWEAFGRHFLAGERHAPGSNALGRRALRSTVDALLSTPMSPWREVPWTAPNQTGGPVTS